MQLVSVNVGQKRTVSAKTGATGIYKLPRSTPVYVGELGLHGDVIVDTENHGGPDQAVYVYGLPDYTWWSQQLETPLAPGTFGENLTVSGLESASLHIGDRLQLQTVTLEVTAPRIPCVTLAARMNDPQFVKKFARAGRFGAYCRVIVPGYVQTDAAVTVKRYAGPQVSINVLAAAFLGGAADKATIERLLSVPIDARSRVHYTEKLAAITNDRR